MQSKDVRVSVCRARVATYQLKLKCTQQGSRAARRRYIPKVHLDLDFSPQLLLYPTVDQLLLVHALERDNVPWWLSCACHVYTSELALAEGTTDFEGRHGPLSRRWVGVSRMQKMRTNCQKLFWVSALDEEMGHLPFGICRIDSQTSCSLSFDFSSASAHLVTLQATVVSPKIHSCGASRSIPSSLQVRMARAGSDARRSNTASTVSA